MKLNFSKQPHESSTKSSSSPKKTTKAKPTIKTNKPDFESSPRECQRSSNPNKHSWNSD